jgi:hypothetical protein
MCFENIRLINENTAESLDWPGNEGSGLVIRLGHTDADELSNELSWDNISSFSQIWHISVASKQ